MAEKRLINAWDMMEWLDNIDIENHHRILRGKKAKRLDTKGVRHMVDTLPTVDAVEVVHAKWECVYDESMGETDVTCSHCKDTRTIKGCYVTVRGEPCYFEDNYCPNCGAKMDGGTDDEQE